MLNDCPEEPVKEETEAAVTAVHTMSHDVPVALFVLPLKVQSVFA
jgi:hypothetical protein